MPAMPFFLFLNLLWPTKGGIGGEGLGGGGGGEGMEEFEVIQLWIPYVCGGYDHCVRIPTGPHKNSDWKKGGTGRYRRGREQKNKKGLFIKFFQTV
jgi:hypothetical protein